MNNYFVSDILHYCNVSLEKCESMPKKKINFYDLTFVLKGEMTYTFDDRICVLKPNDAILLPLGTVRSRFAGTKPVKYVSFNFHMFPDVTLNLGKFIPNCISTEIKKIIAAFPQSHISPYYYSKEKIANILNYILFELLDITSLKSSNEHVLRIVKYIEENITQKMSLQSISNEVGLTKEYTAHIFKKETNKTLTHYLNERKLLLAKELILHNTMSLTQLAAYLGYDNYNYFSRLFKHFFKITPIAFKNRN